MTLRIQFIISLLIIPFSCAYSQSEFRFSSGQILKQSYAPVSRELNYAEVKGNPYLPDDPIEGTVRFTRGKETSSYLRYNAYMDEMEYLEGSKLMVIANPGEIDAVFLGNFVFRYLSYTLKSGTKKKGYLVSVVDGDCKLYKKINVVFEDIKPASTPYDIAKPATFIKRPDTWFISFNDEAPFEITLDKDAVDQVFEKYENVREYAKDKNLKGKKAEDFVKVVEYFNSLNK